MPESVLVSAVRTPVGRAPKGALSTTRPDDLAAFAMIGALEKIPALDRAEVEDVILGCAQPEGEQGWDIARWAALRAGLPVEVPGVTVNRLCSSGLEAIALANLRVGQPRLARPHAQAERDVLENGHVRIQGIVLKDHGDVALLRGDPIDDTTADCDFP